MTSPEIPPQPAAGAPRPVAGGGTATGTALALLVCATVVAVAWLGAVHAAGASARTAVAWGSGAAGVVLCAAVTVAARAVLTGRRLRAALTDCRARHAERDTADAYFADVVVPDVVDRLRNGGSAETALAEAPSVTNEMQRRVLVTLAREVHKGESMRAAALSACANAAGRVQALATSMAADLREMEHRHADEDVLADLLHLDHRTAQTGRIADSIAVLTGARSGRRWAKPIVMESILRGAMGRISGYQRVRLHSTSEAAIAGHAAEGVMHALAELMDNAANFSPPTSEVHVYVEEVAAGIVITVEDGGLVMGEMALRRAQQAVTGEQSDLTTLSGTRLGLAVVGRLARKHGLSVSFRPSAHGGTGVLMRIPRELVTEPRDRERVTAPTPAPRPAAASARGRLTSAPGLPHDTTHTAEHTRQPEAEPAARPGSGSHEGPARESDGPRTGERPAVAPPPQEYMASGLPKRRRGQTLAAVARATASRTGTSSASPASSTAAASGRGDGTAEGPAQDDETPAPRRKRPSGARFGDFRRAVRGTASSGDTGTHPAAPASSPDRSSSLSEDDTE
ncbi:sensor histidine kinase [Streptomyces sp. PHES57]|uniref:sensor histidine kinase n=1 Tax=Streptomyces TaxID=1883 RepID=UPI001CEDA660|nr:ATP-binding protein [Streptomyces sp. PHES57]